MTTATRDLVYRYHVRANRIEAHCRLRFFTAPTGDAVVVATELPDNEGMSITNGAEEVATLVCLDFGIEPARLLWIEHYTELVDGPPERMPDSYDLVRFTWQDGVASDPRWRPLAPAEVALLTEGGIRPEPAP